MLELLITVVVCFILAIVVISLLIATSVATVAVVFAEDPKGAINFTTKLKDQAKNSREKMNEIKDAPPEEKFFEVVLLALNFIKEMQGRQKRKKK